MLLVDAIYNLVTQVPMHVYRAVVVSLKEEEEIVVLDILFMLTYSNVVATPIVYFIFNPYFRVSEKHFLSKIK